MDDDDDDDDGKVVVCQRVLMVLPYTTKLTFTSPCFFNTLQLNSK
jgi:hypothetical protein